jgi:carboxymethylenebutenolidase
MTMKTEWVRTQVGDEHITLYTARMERATTPLPAVIVIQEIFGVDEHIQDVTRRFAEAGYFAVAPDLFSENGERPHALRPEGIELVKKFMDIMPPAAWHDNEVRQQALASQSKETQESFAAVFSAVEKGPAFMRRLHATFEYLQTAEESAGQRVASTGYCMGGSLSCALAATQPELAGAVIYYGRPQLRETIAGVQCPVLGIFAEKDEGINAFLPDFLDAMEAEGKNYEHVMMPDAEHGFFNDTRRSYNVDASRDAWVRTLAFFREVLA